MTRKSPVRSSSFTRRRRHLPGYRLPFTGSTAGELLTRLVMDPFRVSITFQLSETIRFDGMRLRFSRVKVCCQYARHIEEALLKLTRQ